MPKSKIREIPLDNLVTVLEGLGPDAIAALAAQFEHRTFPAGDILTLGRVEAERNILLRALGGEEGVKRWLSGEVQLVISNPTVKPITDSTPHLFTRHGVLLLKLFSFLKENGDWVRPNRDFRDDLPRPDAKKVVEQTARFLRAAGVSAKWQGDEAERLARVIAEVRGFFKSTPGLKRAGNGGMLPGVIPVIEGYDGDYGRLVEMYVTALGLAYKSAFSGTRAFYNYLTNNLAGQTGVWQGSRREAVASKFGKEPTFVVYLPTALSGASYNAGRKVESHLPEGLMLSGAVEAMAGLIPAIKEAARDFKTPGLCFAGDFWLSAGYSSLSFWAYDDNAYFTNSVHLGDISGYFACGLSLFRQ